MQVADNLDLEQADDRAGLLGDEHRGRIIAELRPHPLHRLAIFGHLVNGRVDRGVVPRAVQVDGC